MAKQPILSTEGHITYSDKRERTEQIERIKNKVNEYTYQAWTMDATPTPGIEYFYTADPRMIYKDVPREISPLEAYNQYYENSKNNRHRKSYHLSRIDLTVPDDEEIKYFYIPGEVSYKILTGAIISVLGREVPYNITNIELSYNDLPKFERERIMGIK